MPPEAAQTGAARRENRPWSVFALPSDCAKFAGTARRAGAVKLASADGELFVATAGATKGAGISLDEAVIASHPIGQQPVRLIGFAQVAAAIELKGIAVPMVDDALGPGQRRGTRSARREVRSAKRGMRRVPAFASLRRGKEVGALGVLQPPLNEVERDFAQCLHGGFDVARRAGGRPVNKIPKGAALHALEV